MRLQSQQNLLVEVEKDSCENAPTSSHSNNSISRGNNKNAPQGCNGNSSINRGNKSNATSGMSQPSFTTTRTDNGGNMLFFSSILKAGGQVTTSEADAQQQLVRSGVIKPAASVYGRSMAKTRLFEKAASGDRDTLAASVLAQQRNDSDALVKQYHPETFFELPAGREDDATRGKRHRSLSSERRHPQESIGAEEPQHTAVVLRPKKKVSLLSRFV